MDSSQLARPCILHLRHIDIIKALLNPPLPLLSSCFWRHLGDFQRGLQHPPDPFVCPTVLVTQGLVVGLHSDGRSHNQLSEAYLVALRQIAEQIILLSLIWPHSPSSGGSAISFLHTSTHSGDIWKIFRGLQHSSYTVVSSAVVVYSSLWFFQCFTESVQQSGVACL